MAIGKLKEVKIRELGKHEQYDFSNWLAQEQSIEELNKALEIGIQSIFG